MTQATLVLPQGVNDAYDLVQDDATLHALCAQWQTSPFLAMDTEFIRTSTFFPHVGLIQINAGDRNILVDPLGINDWEPFKALMINAAVVKIFHSCSEDLQVFMVALKLVPYPVFDTQVAAAFLHEGFGCSYQALVRHHLGIDLPKGETRSDWLQRPLDDKQLHYAALDVACLPAIYHTQHAALRATGRLAWLEEECVNLLAQYRSEMTDDFADYYLNLKGAWPLDRRQLAILKALAQWREQRARKRDRPRNWIVQDKVLIDIARSAPASLAALESIDGVSKNFLRHEGQEVLKLVAQARDVAEEQLPAALPRPLDGKAKSRLKKAQDYAESKARELGLPVEVLVRKRWLIDLLQNLMASEKLQGTPPPEDSLLPAGLSGWRMQLLLPGLLDAMR